MPRLSDLTATTSPGSSDVLALVPAGSTGTKKLSLGSLFTQGFMTTADPSSPADNSYWVLNDGTAISWKGRVNGHTYTFLTKPHLVVTAPSVALTIPTATLTT